MSIYDPGEDNRPADALETIIKREMNHLAGTARDELDKLGQKLISQVVRVQALKQQLAAEREARQEAEKLLCYLTPTGSEFAGSPKRCYEWVREHMSSLTRAAMDAHGALNEERERVKALEQDNQYWQDMLAAHKKLLIAYRLNSHKVADQALSMIDALEDKRKERQAK